MATTKSNNSKPKTNKTKETTKAIEENINVTPIIESRCMINDAPLLDSNTAINKFDDIKNYLIKNHNEDNITYNLIRKDINLKEKLIKEYISSLETSMLSAISNINVASLSEDDIKDIVKSIENVRSQIYNIIDTNSESIKQHISEKNNNLYDFIAVRLNEANKENLNHINDLNEKMSENISDKLTASNVFLKDQTNNIKDMVDEMQTKLNIAVCSLATLGEIKNSINKSFQETTHIVNITETGFKECHKKLDDIKDNLNKSFNFNNTIQIIMTILLIINIIVSFVR